MLHFKKQLCIVLIAVLFLGTLCPAISAVNVESMTREGYILDVLSRYLTVEGDTLSKNTRISQGYIVEGNDDPTSRVYFICVQDEYIGSLVVADSGHGGFCSSFTFDGYDSIANVIQSDTPFALCTPDGESLFLITDNSNEKVCGPDNYATIGDKTVLRPERITMATLSNHCELQKATFTNLDFSSVPTMTQSYGGYDGYVAIYDVDHVDNDTVDGKGICWAASIASIGNKKTGQNYSALDLYNLLRAQYAMTPEGTSTWYQRGFNYYVLPCSIVNGGLTGSQVYDNIHNERPILCSFSRYDSSAQETRAHAIVLKGFVGNGNGAQYIYMDPNKTSTVYLDFTDLTPSQIQYTNGTATYTSWYGSAY